MTKHLSEVKRRKVEDILDLRSEDRATSVRAAEKLLSEARDYGLGLKDFLDLAIDPRLSDKPELYRDDSGFLSGYEATVAALHLPSHNDYSKGVVLDLASDTFQTFPGTRALFPQVIDDVLQWRYRQDSLENTTSFISQSRTVSGTEMLTTVVDDAEEDYQGYGIVAELGRVPVRTIRASEHAVRFYKHGGGIRISYEFQRRARLDMLTPFQARSAREVERSKVAVATGLLINGDAVNPAAGVVAQSTLDAGATNGTISYAALLRWLVNRAKAGTPVDTVLGNWDAYIQWLQMFSKPTGLEGRTNAELLAASGFQIGGVPILTGVVNFALSSAVPANQLVGLSKSDTLEELVEANSDIEESERAIQNQSITYVKTVNSGYKLAFPDTRSIFNFGG